jgi:hypothetical protein
MKKREADRPVENRDIPEHTFWISPRLTTAKIMPTKIIGTTMSFRPLRGG